MKAFGIRFGLLLAVASILPACGGGGGGGGGSGSPGPVLWITGVGTGAPGALTMQCNGGTATGGTGGTGGNIFVNGQGGSDIQIATTGTVLTAMAVPAVTPYLGTNPLTVTTNTTLTVGTAGYNTTTPTVLGNDGLTVATGLSVTVGVTLTLNCNVPAVGVRSTAQLVFSDGILNQGTLRTLFQDNVAAGDGASSNGGNLDLTCSNFAGAAGSAILTTGRTQAGVNGGNGGSVTLSFLGNSVNAGTITANGAAGNAVGVGPNGGLGGAVTVTVSNNSFYNTGAITAQGGMTTGAGGLGGGGGGMSIRAPNVGGRLGAGVFYNNALISTMGADGPGGAGNGGGVTLISSGGMLINDGATIMTTGGNAGATAGNGGSGGAVLLESVGGATRISGTVTTTGGTSGTAQGGSGGVINIIGLTDGEQPVPFGVFVGANLNAGGGTGVTLGGSGVGITVSTNCSNNGSGGTPPFGNAALQQAPIWLVGYGSLPGLSTAGGASIGGGSGGTGGVIIIEQTVVLTPAGQEIVGGIHNQANLTSKGGSGSAGIGGSGSGIALRTSLNTINPDPTQIPDFSRSVTNSGTINTSGGNAGGNTTGGPAGIVSLYDFYAVLNTGNITAQGGNSGAGFSGGAGGSITLVANTTCISAAAYITTGGSTVGGAGNAGGNAGAVLIGGNGTVSHSGNITGSGGAATTGTGGIGATIQVSSTNLAASFHGTVTVPGGLGSVVGSENGRVILNGVDASSVLVNGVGTY